MRSSIWATVIPAASTATRCRRSIARGAQRAPTVTPTARDVRNTTPASDRAENTVTYKAYKFGERQPSSTRPKLVISHAGRQVFGARSPGVCPVAGKSCLFGALAGHRRRAGGRGLRVEIAAADHQRAQIRFQVIAQRNSGRDVQTGHLVVGHAVEV